MQAYVQIYRRSVAAVAAAAVVVVVVSWTIHCRRACKWIRLLHYRKCLRQHAAAVDVAAVGAAVCC